MGRESAAFGSSFIQLTPPLPQSRCSRPLSRPLAVDMVAAAGGELHIATVKNNHGLS
jgi:hypothetical protein